MIQNSKVIFHIPHLAGGGAERVAVEVARYFLSKGVLVVFFIHSEKQAYVLPEGIRVVAARSTSHFGRLLELRALIRSMKPAAVLSFMPYANLISLFANIGLRNEMRLVISEHLTVVGDHSTGPMDLLKRVLRRYLYQTGDAIVAVSGGVADDLRRTLAGRVDEKITVIYNPCFIPDETRSVGAPSRAGKTILAVGRLCDDKGFDVLLRAFAQVRLRAGGVRLVIAGEGPSRRELESLVGELGLYDCVSLPGFTNDIRSLYRDADLFVCSSRREGFGNVIVEAMSFGLPVVATRCPHGPNEILEDGRYGHLVDVDDVRGLADALVESLASAGDPLMQISRAREFSLDVIGSRYLEQVGLSRFAKEELHTRTGYPT
ncbi:glycosyltransferase [Paraburkholderia sacchari]|uniref:Glycosyltransferase family 4 protein n=1 Tax=Paraburkholderia sacchari TaxID=159450 RepID=A0A8T6ZBB4_9BURK|nr:glycosyltransferase [Paraburkholderia sacchari]NLP62041.1 glycosyltransferase family 4 protein [Paraburkholderia sacchari]